MRRISNYSKRLSLTAFVALSIAACGGGGGSTDKTPDTFSLGNDIEVSAVSAIAESSVVTVAGINTSVDVTISGGEYRIDGGAYTSAAGKIKKNQTIQVRGVAGAVSGDVVNIELTIGGVTDAITLTLVDSIPPVANVIFPTPVTLTDGTTLKLRGDASDDFGSVSMITATVLDESGATVSTQSIDAGANDDFTDTWLLDITLGAETTNTINVVAVDAAGNVQAAPVVLTVMHRADTSNFNYPVGNELYLGDIRLAKSDFDVANGRILQPREDDAGVVAIDMATGVVTEFLPPNENYGRQLAVARAYPDIGAVYLGSSAGTSVTGKVFDVDIDAPVFSSRLHEDDGARFFDLRLSEDSQFVYVLDATEDALIRINVSTGEHEIITSAGSAGGEVRPIGAATMLEAPLGLILDEDSNRAFLTDAITDSVMEVNLTSGEVRRLDTDVAEYTLPRSIEWLDDGRRFIVASRTGEESVWADYGGVVVEYDLENNSQRVILDSASSLGTPNALQVTTSIDVDQVGELAYLNQYSIGSTGQEGKSSVIVMDLTSGERMLLVNSRRPINI